jgi:hypothetical protein
VTTHPSVDDLSKNIAFYKVIAGFLHEAAKQYPKLDFAIINGLEVRDIPHDF